MLANTYVHYNICFKNTSHENSIHLDSQMSQKYRLINVLGTYDARFSFVKTYNMGYPTKRKYFFLLLLN